LEAYVEQFGAVFERQTKDLASIASPEEVERFQREHDAWKIDRDLRCAEGEKSETARIRELECMAELSEDYWDRRQIQIHETEKKMGIKRVPGTK
jgi:hypothetical protein